MKVIRTRGMSCNNDIGMNQAYVTKVLENSSTPRENRMAVIEYVRKHPEKFTPVADIHDDKEYRDWARRHNGKGRGDSSRNSWTDTEE